MPCENEDNNKINKMSQEQARSKLRESFLKAINELNGQPCNILTYEQSKLEAVFHGWNVDGSEVLVRDLKTPAQDTVETALLRTPDILTLQFNKMLDN